MIILFFLSWLLLSIVLLGLGIGIIMNVLCLPFHIERLIQSIIKKTIELKNYLTAP